MSPHLATPRSSSSFDPLSTLVVALVGNGAVTLLGGIALPHTRPGSPEGWAASLAFCAALAVVTVGLLLVENRRWQVGLVASLASFTVALLAALGLARWLRPDDAELVVTIGRVAFGAGAIWLAGAIALAALGWRAYFRRGLAVEPAAVDQ